MMGETFDFEAHFARLNNLVNTVKKDDLVKASRLIKTVGLNGNRVLLFGNGGSSSIASHLAVDLTKAVGIPSLSFNDPAFTSCFANDFGFEKWIEETVLRFSSDGDLCIFISSSGQSKNIVNGALAAQSVGCQIITFSGFDLDNPLSKLGNVNFFCESDVYNHVENSHQIWALAIVDGLCAEGGLG